MNTPVKAPTQTPKGMDALLKAEHWKSAKEVIDFMLGGRVLKSVTFPAMVLDVPFTQLEFPIDQLTIPWKSLPGGIEAAVVPALPVTVDPPRLTLLPHFIRYVVSSKDRYFVDFQGSFQDYLNRLSQNARHNLRRRIRRFTEFSGGQIQWKKYRHPHEMGEFHRLAGEISTRSWHVEVGGPGFQGAVREEELIELAQNDRVRAYILFHKGKPISFAYCVAQKENLVYKMIGYDQEYAQWSPGNVLYYLFMESLFTEEHYRYFDFTEGTLAYKDHIKTGSLRCAQVLYMRRNVKNLAIVASHLFLERFSLSVGKLMARIGLKRRIKKLIMGKYARPGQV